MRDYRKLLVFQKADAIVLRIFEVSCAFPKSEILGLTSQMRRAAVSVPSNIVEGSSRPTDKEYVRFLGIAYGSARELNYQITLPSRLGWISVKDADVLMSQCDEVCAMITGLVRSLGE